MTYQSKPCVMCGDFAYGTYNKQWLCYPCQADKRRIRRYLTTKTN